MGRRAATFVGIVLGFLVSSPAFAETVTTENLLPEMGDFTTSGGTSFGTGSGCSAGEFCTSGTRGGGGYYQTDFDVPLTQDEINEGFTLSYGITVDSHPSNSVLGTCADIMQSGDCRDIFSLTVVLRDNGQVVEKFEDTEELDFTGIRDYVYNHEVASNNYGLLTGDFEFYGIDAGFPSGFFGPQPSDPFLFITHTIVEDEILLSIIDDDLIDFGGADIDIPVEVETVEIDFEIPEIELDNMAEFEVEFETAAVELEIEIEAELEFEEATPDATVEEEAESVVVEEVEVVVEAQGTESAEPSPEEEASEEKSEGSSPAEKKQAASKMRYNPAIQQQALIVMSQMADKMPEQPALLDTPGFFPDTELPDAEIPVDYRALYGWTGVANGAHDALVQLQWAR